METSTGEASAPVTQETTNDPNRVSIVTLTDDMSSEGSNAVPVKAAKSHFRVKVPWTHRTLNIVKRYLLTILTILGVLFGIALGAILKTCVKGAGKDGEWDSRQVGYVKFAGDMFLNLLMAMVVPLIMSSIAASIATLDIKSSAQIGLKGLSLYMGTTVLAITLGSTLAVLISPGTRSHSDLDTIKASEGTVEKLLVQDTFMDVIRSFFPPNIIQATFQSQKTKLTNITEKNATKPLPIERWKVGLQLVNSTNVMGIIMFSAAIGIVTAKLGERGKPFGDMISSFAEGISILTGWVIWLTPIGVAFLVAANVVTQKDYSKTLKGLAWYILTVMLGLAIHGAIVLPLLYTIITRQLPFRFIINMAPAMATAFGTSSSNACLPVTLKCLEKYNKVDPRVTRFLVPIGATINMDGTALYEAVAVIFIAQHEGKSLNIGEVIVISVSATIASIGAAGIPGAGLVAMVIVLNSVGISEDRVTIVVAIDWFINRFRVVVNVMGDALAVGAIYHSTKLRRTSARPRPSENLSLSSTNAQNAQPPQEHEAGGSLERRESNRTNRSGNTVNFGGAITAT